MNQQDFFEKVITVLEKLHIEYMITGSVGAMLYGIPRMTNDMDLVIKMSEDSINNLVTNFTGDEYYYPPIDFICSQLKIYGQFNIIHIESGSKVDFIIRKNNEFAKVEFSNKKTIPFSTHLKAKSASIEDIIISKLKFYKMGNSRKHLDDIQGILQISEAEIDFKYLQYWLLKLDLDDIWIQNYKHPK